MFVRPMIFELYEHREQFYHGSVVYLMLKQNKRTIILKKNVMRQVGPLFKQIHMCSLEINTEY